jgi:hypothetical protein
MRTIDFADRHLMPDSHRGLFWLRALGRGTLPETVAVNGRTYVLEQTVKHDFYAATGIYASAAGERVVFKVNRTTAVAGLPMRWLGRALRNREVRFYQRLSGLPCVTRLCAIDGQTGFVHTFAAGRPLSAVAVVPDGFFDRLREAMEAVHARGVLYVDSHKQQNFIVGDGGEPWLIDFQISLDGRFLPRWVRRQLQQLDVYHVLKHKSRLRPDELRPEEARIVEVKPLLSRIHRVYSTPYQKLLAWVFHKLEARGRVVSGSE